MIVAALIVMALAVPGESELREQLPEIFAKSSAHYKALGATVTPLAISEKEIGKGRVKSKAMMPHGFNRKTGQHDMRTIYWWTAGHFPGSLWYLYEATGDEFFKTRAKAWTETLAPNAKVTSNHDVGFIMYCSYGNARRLLKTDRYDELLVETAKSLSSRVM